MCKIMDVFYLITFILVGFGVPFYFTAKNTHPKNVLKRLINELEKQPRKKWHPFFTSKGIERWDENINFKIKDLQEFEIADCTYNNYTWKYKVKLATRNQEGYYCFELAKNPSIGAKSRWIINNIYR